MNTQLISRRDLLKGMAALTAGAAISTAARSQIINSAQRPDPKTFQTGDFVWPKPPGAFVPYAGSPEGRLLVAEAELREEQWNELRVEFIRATRASASVDEPALREYKQRVADAVEAMTYTKFFHAYTANVSPDDFQVYGVGQLAYVGHVAIIELDEATGKPFVIEAVLGQSLACKSCVQRVPYDDWLKARGDALVWHGRLRGIDTAKRSLVAAVAKTQLSKPYRFFNFDLLDDNGFYCSKLLWYSVMKATGIALDGKTDSRRYIWFSPLQAIQSKSTVEILSSPGNYRNI